MAYLQHVCKACKLSEHIIRSPILIQFRWKKEYKRKPLWMPTAKSKFYRIPQHPHVSPEENQLKEDLMEEYYIKLDSMRKLLKEEMKQKFEDEGNTLKRQKESEDKFQLLLKKNQEENERIKAIREETLEKQLQEKEFELLQCAEAEKKRLELRKIEIEEIVRKEKEKISSFITYKNLEEAVENALDNPVNYNFAVNANGSLKWEGKPPEHFEEEMKRKIMESIANES